VDKQEADHLLDQIMGDLRAQPYERLLRYQEPDAFDVVGHSGTSYQVEIQALWDDKNNRTLRVMGSIDDGGWCALHPLTRDFIIAPDGTFVGE
jgi:hypothetical protein